MVGVVGSSPIAPTNFQIINGTFHSAVFIF